MATSRSSRPRLWAACLAAIAIAATGLTVAVNPLGVTLACLAILVATIAVGLLTNVWGGLLASAAGVFAIVMFYQYAGVYVRETRILNVGFELAAYLLAGPAAGALAGTLDRMQTEADRWLARAEELDTQDETLGALKPEWARVRLEEEALRAASARRPLSIMLARLEPRAADSGRPERLAALQALVRLARAAAPRHAVVAHAGGDQVLIILPEQSPDEAGAVVNDLRARVEREAFFPQESQGAGALGEKLGAWGTLRAGVAGLNGHAQTGAALLARAEERQRV